METKELLINGGATPVALHALPALDLTHIRNLTDNTGIIQHAIFNIPNRKEGYCLDDNARALLLCVMLCNQDETKQAIPLLQSYLSFIHYMQTDDGEFRNFLSYSKYAHEERGSEDSFGRTIMALGYLVNESPNHMLSKTAADIFIKAYGHIDKLTSLRGIANSMIGVCKYIRYNYPDDLNEQLVLRMADKLLACYHNHKKPDWHWFEPVLTYDNAMLPLALLHAYDISRYELYLSVAIESMQFLELKVWHDGIVSPIGNFGWMEQGGPAAQFDQQGIDVMAMVLFYQQAFHVTDKKEYLTQMCGAYQWFLGKNDLGLSLYDPATGGCADGLHSEGISLNQGAESTLAYWISHMAVAAALQQ
jgi:hypothetical protein